MELFIICFEIRKTFLVPTMVYLRQNRIVYLVRLIAEKKAIIIGENRSFPFYIVLIIMELT